MNTTRTNQTRKEESSGNTAGGCLVLLVIIFLVWNFGPWTTSKDKAIQQIEALNKAQQDQIKTLQKSQQALENLVNFIEKEKTESKNSANQIKQDIQNLQKIQMVDQVKVDAIFAEQDKKKEQSLLKEWFTAFIIGVISSVAFQILWNLGRHYFKRKIETSE